MIPIVPDFATFSSHNNNLSSEEIRTRFASYYQVGLILHNSYLQYDRQNPPILSDLFRRHLDKISACQFLTVFTILNIHAIFSCECYSNPPDQRWIRAMSTNIIIKSNFEIIHVIHSGVQINWNKVYYLIEIEFILTQKFVSKIWSLATPFFRTTS